MTTDKPILGGALTISLKLAVAVIVVVRFTILQITAIVVLQLCRHSEIFDRHRQPC